ncbi:hypothetical protein JCM19274_4392 [Algibacter lectus]|uniref:Uncharacterized protein n=1 Tax=Algibacter lectus TaxID=221126 RepID=A0A090X207_9FLAO|nr:hypothetical protein JCM19274_4392 [Algibacter lectus]
MLLPIKKTNRVLSLGFIENNATATNYLFIYLFMKTKY